MIDQIKSDIVSALAHPEASEGLYFTNLWYLHEEDERPAVSAPEEEILEALHELLREGRIAMDDGPGEPIFYLPQH